MSKRLSVLFMLVMGFSVILKAQDPHFSQFYSTPLNFNPALAGTNNGTFRINTIYRDQWTSAVQDPLTTFSLGADIKLPLEFGQLKKKPDILGLGISFNADKVRTFDLNTTSINLIGAYHKSLNQRKERYLGVGFVFGVSQRNINYEDLVFEDQFNTLDAFNLPTSEAFPSNNFGFIDLGVGLNYTSKYDSGRLNVGASYYHFHQPNISFYSEEDCPSCVVETQNLLKPRLVGYVSFTTDINTNLGISPRLLYQNQGEFNELTVGTNLIFKINQEVGSALHVGSWARVVNNVNGFGMESIIFMVGLERKNLLLGFSYDHNLPDLFGARVGLNAFELSLTYIGEHDNNFDICPKF